MNMLRIIRWFIANFIVFTLIALIFHTGIASASVLSYHKSDHLLLFNGVDWVFDTIYVLTNNILSYEGYNHGISNSYNGYIAWLGQDSYMDLGAVYNLNSVDMYWTATVTRTFRIWGSNTSATTGFYELGSYYQTSGGWWNTTVSGTWRYLRFSNDVGNSGFPAQTEITVEGIPLNPPFCSSFNVSTDKTVYNGSIPESINASYCVPDTAGVIIILKSGDVIDESSALYNNNTNYTPWNKGYYVFPNYPWNINIGNYTAILIDRVNYSWIAEANFSIINPQPTPTPTYTPFPTPNVTYTAVPTATACGNVSTCEYPYPTNISGKNLTNISYVAKGIDYLNITLLSYNYTKYLSFAKNITTVFWAAIPVKVMAAILFCFSLDILLAILKGKS